MSPRAALILLLLAVTTHAQERRNFTVPFAVSRGWILIPAKAGGHAGTFLLDTGAQTSIVSLELAKLGHDKGEKQVTGINGANTSETVLIRLDLGGTLLHERNVLVTNLDKFTYSAGRKVDGVVGMDVLSQYRRIEIDLEAKALKLSE